MVRYDQSAVRRAWWATVLMTLMAWWALQLSAPVAAAPAVNLRQVAQNLSLPIELVPAKDGSNRLFIVEQGGRIKILQNGTVLGTSFLDISGAGLISCCNERGLLGLAFHPQYASNRAFYIFYTATNGALTVARYFADPNNPNRALTNTDPPVLSIPHASFGNHNGGHLAFGPDGYLYIGTGDGGSGGDPDRNGQKLTSRLGKLLRIAVDGGNTYTIPPGNPYVGETCSTRCPEIWAYGLRNPWKFAFDRVTGDLFIGDVGQGAVEEVDFQRAGAPGGANYGWGVREGNDCYNNNYFGPAGACTSVTGDTRPILTYDHGSTGGLAITGGYRYRGRRSAALEGYYIYGDYVSKRVWAARPNAAGVWTTEVLIPPDANVSSISSFGEDEAGELYLVDYGNGKIWAIDGPNFALTSMISRKTHATAGTFDLDIRRDAPLGGAIAVEPRGIGAGHTIVFTFNAAITSPGSATVTDPAGNPAGAVSLGFSGNTVTATLTGIADSSRLLVTLSDVNGTAARLETPVGFLLGDINSSGRVSAADISAMKAQVGQVAGTGNYRLDLGATGAIQPLDVTTTRMRSGVSLP